MELRSCMNRNITACDPDHALFGSVCYPWVVLAMLNLYTTCEDSAYSITKIRSLTQNLTLWVIRVVLLVTVTEGHQQCHSSIARIQFTFRKNCQYIIPSSQCSELFVDNDNRSCFLPTCIWCPAVASCLEFRQGSLASEN